MSESGAGRAMQHSGHTSARPLSAICSAFLTACAMAATDGASAPDGSVVVWIKALADVPDAPKVPWLHERWCWEGDETPLPGKWAAIQQAHTSECTHTSQWFKDTVVASPHFDPQSTFFLTHRYELWRARGVSPPSHHAHPLEPPRSTAVGTVTVWPDIRDPTRAAGCIQYLAAIPGPEQEEALACLVSRTVAKPT